MNLWSGNISSSSWLESSAHGSSEKSLVRKGFIAEPLLDYYKVCFLKYSLSTTVFCVCEWLRESVRCSFSFFFSQMCFLEYACLPRGHHRHLQITIFDVQKCSTSEGHFYWTISFLLVYMEFDFVSAPSFFPSTFFSLLP